MYKIKFKDIIIPNKEMSITEKQGKFLYRFIKKLSPKKTLEIGMGYGCSSIYILSALINSKSIHYVIDPFELPNLKEIAFKNVNKFKLNKHLYFINDFSYNALPALLEKGVLVDFVFIDGNHKYDNQFIDFFYSDLLLNQKGFIIFHDAWMRSTQLLVSWIKKNKNNYLQIKTPLKNFIMFKKEGRDERPWYHFREFYTLKSIPESWYFKITNKSPY